MAPLPSLIGRYRVERELGGGAMGIVYLAHDPDIERRVAIKLVRADLLDGEDRENFLSRFRREAQAAGRCTHPNIVSIYDFAMHENNPYLTMEYVDGVALGRALASVGRFTPANAVAVIKQVLDALSAAHEIGIVHRDVKPANILMLATGQVKVTDFGISRINSSAITQAGALIGTPAYMSPEQCRGDDVDARSDLFSVGAVLYELLSGKRAFKGDNASEIIFKVMTEQPTDLALDGVGVPDALLTVLRKAMTKNREMRFGSAHAMADALQASIQVGAAMRLDPAQEPTLMRTPRWESETAAPFKFDDATLDTIARRLAWYIGPIARHMVSNAARGNHSIEGLCETVSRAIEQTADRDKFLKECMPAADRTGTTSSRPGVQGSGSAGAGGTSEMSFTPDQIERIERALTRVVGPIAKLLIQRSLKGATSEAVLWERAAAFIERPADRDGFLRLRTKA